MTNIELLRTAKVGDRFRKGDGDVLEIVEMPKFDVNGYPKPTYGKMLVNGSPGTWITAFAHSRSVNDADDGLTPIPAEPVVDLKPARELKVVHAEFVHGDLVYSIVKAAKGGFVGCRHYKNSTLYIYVGPSYAEAVAACEADLEAAQ